jgi:hypothetical protein
VERSTLGRAAYIRDRADWAISRNGQLTISLAPPCCRIMKSRCFAPAMSILFCLFCIYECLSYIILQNVGTSFCSSSRIPHQSTISTIRDFYSRSTFSAAAWLMFGAWMLNPSCGHIPLAAGAGRYQNEINLTIRATCPPYRVSLSYTGHVITCV